MFRLVNPLMQGFRGVVRELFEPGQSAPGAFRCFRLGQRQKLRVAPGRPREGINPEEYVKEMNLNCSRIKEWLNANAL